MDSYGLIQGFPGNSNPPHHLFQSFNRKDLSPVQDILYPCLVVSIQLFLTNELAFWARLEPWKF